MCYNRRHACRPAEARAGPVFCRLCALRPDGASEKTNLISAGFGLRFGGLRFARCVDHFPGNGGSVFAADSAVRGIFVLWCSGYVRLSDRVCEVSYRATQCLCIPTDLYHDVRRKSVLRSVGVDSPGVAQDRKSTRLNSSHLGISYAVFCLKKKNTE